MKLVEFLNLVILWASLLPTDFSDIQCTLQLMPVCIVCIHIQCSIVDKMMD